MRAIKLELDVTPEEEADILSILLNEERSCATLAKNALTNLQKKTWTQRSKVATKLLVALRGK